MSGETQPRKRKDKKRKKDEGVELLAAPTFTTSKGESDDTTFHVHKDGGTGGGICAKIIFFILFSALIVLVGMIITEHRGSTDLDTVDTKSRFSSLFEGWIDDSPGHDEDDHIDHTVADEHDEEDEAEDHDDEEESLDHDEDEHEEHDEVEEDEEETDVGKASEEETEEELPPSEEAVDDNDDEEEDQERPDDEEGEEDEIEEDEEEEPVEDELSVEQTIEDDDDTGDQEDEQEDKDDEAISTEREERSTEDDDETTDDIDEEDADEQDKPDEGEGEEEEEEKADTPDEGYESEEKLEEEEVKPTESKERKAKKPQASAEVKEVEDANQSPMVIKVGVGMAILVVAYVVLVRKRRAAPPEEVVETEIAPDLSRRNTIVVPPKLQEIVQDIEQDVEEESEEEGESETEEEESEGKPRPRSIRAKYQELRTTYTRSLTPEIENATNRTSGANDDYEGEEEEEEAEEEEAEDDEESEEADEEELESDPDEGEDDDEQLLKRLEEKYGKLKRFSTGSEDRSEGSDSDNQNYPYANITNKADWEIKDKLDEGQKSIQNNPAYAITLFDALLKTYPFSPRSLFGKAQALDKLADIERSNQLLQRAITMYLTLLNLKDVPDALFLAAAERCISRMRFSGNYQNLVLVHKMLIDRFRDTPKHRNDLAVTYLTINRIKEARTILKDTLAEWPNDGVALVHYGFILKTSDNDLKGGIDYMQRGINTKEPGVIDGRFYFHLGDALARLGRKEEAMKLYEEGVQHGLFLSKYQRSLYNVNHLTGKPWWSKDELPYQNLFITLEMNYKEIYREGLAVMNKKGYFEDESENLKDKGDWKQFELYARGRKNVENCKKCPVTCQIIDSFPDAKGCKRGQTKFSVMHPGTHVWPHCGPTNCRLRAHLGLKVPRNTYIRVADEMRSWEEGKVFIFDDSFEHEVWHNGTDFRLVLIVDVWHPELTPTEKRSLSPI